MEQKIFEWDENKRQSNIAKHGIDFTEVTKVFDGFYVKTNAKTPDYGEERYLAIGMLDEREITIVYTTRGEKTRIISVRRARVEERELFNKEAEKNGYGLRETGRDD